MELDDIKEIKAIIDLMKKNDLSVFEIEKDGFRLKLQKGPANQTTMPVAPIVVSTPKSPATSAEAAITTGKSADAAPMKDIVSPMVGTFYRAPGPGESPFVEVGSAVEESTQVCILEVMKLMSAVVAGARGVVAEVCCPNGAAVAYGDVLFRIRPA